MLTQALALAVIFIKTELRKKICCYLNPTKNHDPGNKLKYTILHIIHCTAICLQSHSQSGSNTLTNQTWLVMCGPARV